jgi:Cu2+-exporting ATPase
MQLSLTLGSSAAVTAGGNTSLEATSTAAARLNVFDEPAEWERFSERKSSAAVSGASMSASFELWESQVLVRGMHCAACSLMLEQALLASPGVVSVKVSSATQRASVVWSAVRTKPSVWLLAPQASGYSLSPALDTLASDDLRKEARLALWRWLVAGFCMMQVMMYAFPAYITEAGDITPDIQQLLRIASWVLTLPVLLFSAKPFFANALRDLRQRSISMDLPVALGILITFAVSSAATFEPQGWWSTEVYFDSLTMFVFFLLTGRWLEQRLRMRTTGALDSLLQRLPDSVERLGPSGEFVRVAARKLAAGDVVRVLPGQAFPADGRIVQGQTHVDEALLTGEARPVARPLGAAVMAGSFNLSAAVHVLVEKLGQHTRYAGIVSLMQRAALDKPRLAQVADRLARPFLWLVLLAAAGAAVYWWPTDPARAVMAAVAVLIVTCPCALSLATPTAMLTAAGQLARQGVLVRRLQALEALASIDTVVFDKTGTLTQARMGLRHVEVRPGLSSDAALAIAVALAKHSLHPLSRAIYEAFESAGRTVASVQLREVAEHAGQGLSGSSADASRGEILLGSAAFCGITAASLSPGVPASDIGPQVFLADASGWLARFDFDELARPEAAAAVQQLKGAGLQVRMLSGDGAAAVQRMARQLGIAPEHALAQCTPQDKLANLQALQQRGHRVMMVGDGLNDGPVLARADVSVALGDAVPLAQAQSDFIMAGHQLERLAGLPALARRTLTIVKQNLAWAAAYNALCVPLALVGYLPAWLAGLGMALSSLLVLANAARLSRSLPPASVAHVHEVFSA